VTGVQVIPSGAPEICVARTNGNWFLSKPLFIRGNPPPSKHCLMRCKNLFQRQESAPPKCAKIKMLTLNSLSQSANPFEHRSRRTALAIRRWQQNRAGNQVYLRVVGVDGAFVADAGWLNLVSAFGQRLAPTHRSWTRAKIISITSC